MRNAGKIAAREGAPAALPSLSQRLAMANRIVSGPLSCSQCGEKYSSALEYLTHRTVSGTDGRTACERRRGRTRRPEAISRGSL